MTLLQVRRQFAFDTTDRLSHLSIGFGNWLFCGNGSPHDYSWQPRDDKPYEPCQYCEFVREAKYAACDFITAEQIEESVKPLVEWQATLRKPVQMELPI